MCFAVNQENKNALKKQLELWTQDELDDLAWTPRRWADAFGFPRLPVLLGDRSLRLVQWGLVPFWVKTDDQAASLRAKTLNARAETLFTLPSFRDSAPAKRGLLPVNGFFEYQHRDGGKVKVPYRISLQGREAFFLGVLWAERRGELTFSVVTMPSNTLMSQIHNSKQRQPVIIEEKNAELWLTARKESDLQPLFVPDDGLALEAVETEGRPKPGETA